MKQSGKYWKISEFKKATAGMTFEEGRKFTADLVASILKSKEELAEYDKDFFEKIGYTREGKEKYAWNSFKNISFKIALNEEVNATYLIRKLAMNLHSYLSDPAGMKLITAILLNKKTVPKLTVKSKIDQKLLIYEINHVFKNYKIVGSYIDAFKLGERIFNNIEGYKKNYVIWLIKNMTESDYKELAGRQKN